MGNFYKNGIRSFKEIWNNNQNMALRATVNNDKQDKVFSYCSTCENRFGMGTLEAHLGDETWLNNLDLDASEKEKIISHRSRSRSRTQKERL